MLVYQRVSKLNLPGATAGPPCPPWSSAGSRKGTKDPRAEVFWRVIDLIAELVRRPGDDSLRCFVLENVEGIKFDTPGGRGIDEVLRRLRESVPAFKIRIYDMNSQDGLNTRIASSLDPIHYGVPPDSHGCSMWSAGIGPAGVQSSRSLPNVSQDGFGLAPAVASLSRQRRWADALDVVPNARRGNVGLNVFLASACINAAGGKSWQLSIRLLEDAVTTWRLRPDAHVFASLSSCCAQGSQWIQAQTLLVLQLHQLMRPTSVARNVVAAVVRWREATRLVDYTEPMPDQILSLVSGLSRSNCWRRCLPLVASARPRCSKELAAINAIAACCVQTSQWREAVRIILGQGVDTIGFNIVMTANGSNMSGWQRATGTLQTMSLKRTDATVASYNSLLAQHAAAEEWQHALRLLATKEADALSFSSSMSACQKSLQWSKVLTLLRNMASSAQQCDLVCLNSAVAAAPSLPAWRRAVETMSLGSAERRLLLDEITCSETLTLCASSKQWLVAEVLLAQMALVTLEADWWCFIPVLQSFASGANPLSPWPKALTLAQDLGPSVLVQLSVVDAAEGTTTGATACFPRLLESLASATSRSFSRGKKSRAFLA
eukprot:s3540_g2.t1